jgi:DNA invertase Pin-like site-specific DNA recombinase
LAAAADRLTRSVSFLSRLLDAGVDVKFADLPQIEGATGRFLLHQMVAVAELEAGMISNRIKAALKQARKRGSKLGGNRNTVPTSRARALAAKAVGERADAKARDILPAIQALQTAGVTSLNALAAGLNAQGIPTVRGSGTWQAVQVKAVLDRVLS